MSDEIEQAPEQAPETEVTAPTVEELQATLEAATKALETQKTEIAGLNRKVSEEQKTYKELKQSSMSAEEKRQAEIAEMQAELTNSFRESTMLKYEIPNELAGLIKGSNKQEIEAETKIISDYRLSIESTIAKENEELKTKLAEYELKAKSGGAPKIGNPDTTTMTLAEKTALALANR